MTMSGMEYIASQGETWDSISLVIWDNENYATDLLCANPSLSDILVFEGGEVLEVPVVEVATGAEDEEDTDDSDEDDDTESIEPMTAPWKS